MTKLFCSVLVILTIIPVMQAQQPIHIDKPFVQDWSESVLLDEGYNIHLQAISSDRNGSIQILSSTGLMMPHKDKIVADRRYRPMMDMQIRDMIIYRDQFVYLTDEAVLSNAWAGTLYLPHAIPTAHQMAAGKDFDFLLGSDADLRYVKEGQDAWQYAWGEKNELKEIVYDEQRGGFWIVTEKTLSFFDPAQQSLSLECEGSGFASIVRSAKKNQVLIGTKDGLKVYEPNTKQVVPHEDLIPWHDITCITNIDGQLWIGSKRGAFMRREDGSYAYYASRRWLPNDEVIDIAKGPDKSVLVLTTKGMAQIHFEEMTLEEKAMHYEKQVRLRHIRHGFNSEGLRLSTPGDLSTGSYHDSDNDGLWTSMYLGSQLFRYAVTGSEEALQNAIESFEAMERLHEINGIAGFPSRSFMRAGYAKHDKDAWHNLDEQWDWKGTTSSDEAIGHYFAFCLMAEIVKDEDLRQRAIGLIEAMTDHIMENDLYFVDIDGKPTRWGRWNPEYVNGFPPSVGDRKLNSSNITGFLQAAYHVTGKEKYKQKAYELFDKHGYLDNLKRPMKEIGLTEDSDLSALLSESWNHSDDEMYFLSYWYLYPYAFTDELKTQYKEAIRDHWDIERPEKDPLWNFCYAMTGASEFDLAESIWYLQEYPLDMIDWTIQNSHRTDIELLPPNFRDQTTKAVLPPDETPIHKHNTNTFLLDRNRGGRTELSGDLFLLPYWMGRYLKVISAPKE